MTVGIDAGSRAIKIVLFDAEKKNIIDTGLTNQGVHQNKLAMGLLHRLLNEHDLSMGDITRIVATGYGRNLIECADTTITEITCHAAGVQHLIPSVATVVDIGGQDSKLLKLNSNGQVVDFVMNDRCAAGTGRFLEIVASRLEVTLDELNKLARESNEPATISSMCVVFAETEIIGLLASGVAPEDIIAGVQSAICGRIAAMAGRRIDPPVIFTGGVALLPAMVDALSRSLNQPVNVCPHAQMTGALGAALLAAKNNGK
jgi:predicted CoA-substrate-specific enzyme activase